MYCTKCGTKLEDNAAFCHNCGVSVEADTAKAEGAADAQFAGTVAADSFIDDDVVALIGKEKESYYVARFAEMKQKNKKATWNWCSFLIAPVWFIYRKMYLYGAILWLASIIIADVSDMLDLVFMVLSGVFGNYIYMTWLEKQALQAKTMSEPAKTQFIEKNKGTSAAAAGISVGIVAIASTIIGLIFAIIF